MQNTFRNILCLFFVVFASFFVNSQPSNTIYQEKFEENLKLGFKYYDERKADSAKFFLSIIDSLIQTSQFDSSNFYRKETLEATLLIKENNTAESVQKLLKALTYFKQKKDSSNVGFVLLKLGVANYYLNRRLVTKDYMIQALVYKQHLPKREITRIYQNIGSVDLEEGMMGNDSLIYSAIERYKKVIEIYKEEDWLIDEILATSLLAECYNQLNNYDAGLKIIDKAILLSKKVDNKTQEGFALIKKASFLRNNSVYIEALEIILIAKPIFSSQKNKLAYLYALLEEKKILVSLKRFKEATIIGNEIYSVSIDNYNTQFSDKVAEMDAKYKTAEKEKEIAEQKVEITAQESKAKQGNYLLLGLLFVFVFIVVVGVFIYKQQKLKQQKLEEKNRLKDQVAQITLQNELHEERLRISRDLHDNIGSQLTFIISSVDNMKYLFKSADEKLNNKLTDVSNFTRTTITQLRDTIWALNKDEISIEDLKVRLYNYIENAKLAQEQTSFEFKVTLATAFQLNSIQGVSIYRIVQEAINNTMKYAAATNVSLTILENNEHVIFSIKDDGVGFNLAEIQLGNGLENIKSRSLAIGAAFDIISEPAKGTEILLTLPKARLN